MHDQSKLIKTWTVVPSGYVRLDPVQCLLFSNAPSIVIFVTLCLKYLCPRYLELLFIPLFNRKKNSHRLSDLIHCPFKILPWFLELWGWSIFFDFFFRWKGMKIFRRPLGSALLRRSNRMAWFYIKFWVSIMSVRSNIVANRIAPCFTIKLLWSPDPCSGTVDCVPAKQRNVTKMCWRLIPECFL